MQNAKIKITMTLISLFSTTKEILILKTFEKEVK